MFGQRWNAASKLNVHIQDMSSLGIVLLLKLDSTEFGVLLASVQVLRTWCCFNIQMWDLKRHTLSTWVPWCLWNKHCFTGSCVMCIIAVRERSVRCASLCPFTWSCNPFVWRFGRFCYLQLPYFIKGFIHQCTVSEFAIFMFCLKTIMNLFILTFFLSKYLLSLHPSMRLMMTWHHNSNLNIVLF